MVGKGAGRRVEATPERVVRLISMVQLVVQAGEMSVGELAEHFEVSEAQVYKDLNLLWLTGTPGYMPEDLIDFDASALDRGVVRVTQSRGLARPLNFGVRESIALIAALNALKEVVEGDGSLGGSVGDIDALIAKLSVGLGGSARALRVQLASGADAQVISVLRQGVAGQVPVRIVYVSQSDRRSERVVEPFGLFHELGHVYVSAFCRLADDYRLFRTDRIVDAVLVEGERFGVRDGEARMSVSLPQVEEVAQLRLRSQAQWMVETIPHDSVVYCEDGTIEMSMQVVDRQWFRSFLLANSSLIVSVCPPVYVREMHDVARETLDAYSRLDGWVQGKAGDGV